VGEGIARLVVADRHEPVAWVAAIGRFPDQIDAGLEIVGEVDVDLHGVVDVHSRIDRIRRCDVECLCLAKRKESHQNGEKVYFSHNRIRNKSLLFSETKHQLQSFARCSNKTICRRPIIVADWTSRSALRRDR
jgi:hypothetical protein